ncbi:MAG: alpha/beta hydrolase domain-containing protein, partial [bacterium]|nr:alpha/beta hydrolase domain-containing protein [bacterium]
GSFNHRFAQPSRHSSGHTDVFYPTEQFPFNDLPQTDSVTGKTVGLLDRCEAQGVTPRIFYTNTSTEYWNRGASLVHTDVAGAQDVALPECVRVYHFASTQHGPGEIPAGARETWPPNPVNFRYVLRALLVAMDAWVRDGEAPPESRYGSISEGTLVRAAAVSFPKIPEVDLLKRMRVPLRLNHGDSWKEGTISKEPPDLGAPYGVLVPALDIDGNEVTGIRMPEELVPLGTFTGWRFRPANHGASDAMVGLAGMWVPFARTEVERETRADSRPSVEARYANQEAYVGCVARAALELVEARLILPQDVTQVLRRAEKMYTWVMEEGITP